MKKILIAVLALLVIVGAYLAYRWFSQRQASRAITANYETAQIEMGTLTTTINATGKVRSAQSATLFWETSGTVEAVNVQIGDQVEAGETLATLAQSSLPQSVIMAQADLENSKKALQDLYTQAETAKTTAMHEIAQYAQDVRDAQYQLDNFTIPTNQSNLSTMEALAVMEEKLNQARAAFEPYKFSAYDNPTRQDLKKALDEAQASYNAAVKRVDYEYQLAVAKANLEKAKKDYETWKDGPTSGDVAAAKAKITAAEATLRQAWIEAPFAGTITKVIPLPGDQVSAKQEAFRLDNLTSLYVDLDVSEVDINQVRVGLPVTVTFDAIRGKQYHGEVTKVAMVSNENSDTANYTVTVKLNDANAEVRPGMTSAVEIVIEQTEQALLVPNQAIRYENGVQVVYVLTPGKDLQPVEIQIGASSDTYSQVIGGNLAPGDVVALNSVATTAAEGMPPGGGFSGGGGPFGRSSDGGQP